MKALAIAELDRIAKRHGIEYRSIEAKGVGSIGTKISREFAVPRPRLFELLSDPLAHQRLFSQFKLIQPIDSTKFRPLIQENEIVSLEWVDEGGAKLAFARTTILPPTKIVKEVITNPFSGRTEDEPQDRKKGRITWEFDDLADEKCRLTCQSDFEVSEKSVFVRPLIDTVWIDFIERLMIEVGELAKQDKLIV